jgi:hypothetical protein
MVLSSKVIVVKKKEKNAMNLRLLLKLYLDGVDVVKFILWGEFKYETLF